MRVLIVDDKEENRYYLKALLEGNGYEVAFASHGAEALVKARQSRPDVVVSDLLMPVMDGYALLRHWKADDGLASAPFIVCTATYTEPEDEELALSLGADAFILKPVEPDEFIARLQAVQATGERATPTPWQRPPQSQEGLLREYNETLIRKLEQKTLQLDETNRRLQRDMAAREAAEAALRRAEGQLRQAQKMEAIGQLAAGVAHDFNNLLSVILSYASLIVDALPPDDPIGPDVAEIQSAARRAADLTAQLLTFSRQRVLKPRQVDLNAVVRGFHTMLRPLLGANLQLSIRCGESLGQVLIDPGQAEQILMNLVVNARDAMPTGGSITIELANVTLDPAYAADNAVTSGPYVLLAVSDTGHGMDAATRARVFEPFFTTKEKGKGTGLGLATVYGIVTQSGGHVRVSSEPGAGTTFQVYFPRRDGPEILDGPADADARTTRPAPGGEHILHVDDESALVKFTERVLRRLGYRVSGFTDPVEALRAFRSAPDAYHAVVTDLTMPGMSGFHLIREVRRARAEIPVVVTSGCYRPEDAREAEELGLRALLLKPITMEALELALKEELERSEPRPSPDGRTLRG